MLLTCKITLVSWGTTVTILDPLSTRRSVSSFWFPSEANATCSPAGSTVIQLSCTIQCVRGNNSFTNSLRKTVKLNTTLKDMTQSPSYLWHWVSSGGGSGRYGNVWWWGGSRCKRQRKKRLRRAEEEQIIQSTFPICSHQKYSKLKLLHHITSRCYKSCVLLFTGLVFFYLCISSIEVRSVRQAE